MIYGASAALFCSDIPWNSPIGYVRIDIHIYSWSCICWQRARYDDDRRKCWSETEEKFNKALNAKDKAKNFYGNIQKGAMLVQHNLKNIFVKKILFIPHVRFIILHIILMVFINILSK